MTTPLVAVVLAAGHGTRMRSARPKPLHVLCGRPMVLHILDALAELSLERAVVVVGHGAERVTKELAEDGPPGLVVDFVEQLVRRGTGDALQVALTAFPDPDLDVRTTDDEGGDLLVVPGDTPLLRSDALRQLADAHRASGAAATLLTARLPDPTGYGRVVRDRVGRVLRVVEQGDASPEELLLDEVNTSIYCFRRNLLAPALRRLQPDNAQGELYLTDVVAVLVGAGHGVGAVLAPDATETLGVNDRAQLAVAEVELRRRTNARWLVAGVSMVDPATTYLDTSVRLAPDVTIFPGVTLSGSTSVAAGAEVRSGSRLHDTVVGAGAVVDATVATHAEIGAGAVVGPFATLGPGSSVPPGVVTGPSYADPGVGAAPG